jgi:hypothetical protein
VERFAINTLEEAFAAEDGNSRCGNGLLFCAMRIPKTKPNICQDRLGTNKTQETLRGLKRMARVSVCRVCIRAAIADNFRHRYPQYR